MFADSHQIHLSIDGTFIYVIFTKPTDYKNVCPIYFHLNYLDRFPFFNNNACHWLLALTIAASLSYFCSNIPAMAGALLYLTPTAPDFIFVYLQSLTIVLFGQFFFFFCTPHTYTTRKRKHLHVLQMSGLEQFSVPREFAT